MNNTMIVKEIRMENTSKGHSKMWIGYLYKDDTVVTEWGKIGYEMQSKEFPDAGKAFFDKKVKEKEKKGYIIVS